MFIAFNNEMRRAADDVAKCGEVLSENSNWIGFGIGADNSNHVTRETIIRGFVHLRPCVGYDRRGRSNRSSWRIALRRFPSMPLRVVEQCPDADAIALKRAPRPILVAVLKFLWATCCPAVPKRAAAIAEFIFQGHSDLQPNLAVIGRNSA